MKNIFLSLVEKDGGHEVKASEVKDAWSILNFCFLVRYISFISQLLTYQKWLIKILFSFSLLVFKSIKKQSLAYL